MDGSLLATADAGYMMPWSFLFATALIASALDAFARRLFHPVVLTTWFFGLAVCASIGSWSIVELTAGAICLMTPHFLICSFAARSAEAKSAPAPVTKREADPEPERAETFALETPTPVSKETQKRAA